MHGVRRSLGLAAVAAVLVAVALAVLLGLRQSDGAGSADPTPTEPSPTPGRPPTVLLVPGYGGGTAGLDALAAAIRAEGRQAEVVALPGDGIGALAEQATSLDAEVAEALDAGSPAVDIVGYSAGGVVARLWVQQQDDPDVVRRVVTLGSPHHGTGLAALAVALQSEACAAACQELVPGSALLAGLPTPVPTPPEWLALWSTQDEVVTPPESGALEGAVSTSLQAVCPALAVSHDQLPTDPVVTAFVLDALAGDELSPPDPARCP